tara:strand:+ start:93 stop:755 length:663 start_codon:yes stop_codon:yes gene_type:complete
MIIINLKNYFHSRSSLNFIKKISKSKNANKTIVAASATDLNLIQNHLKKTKSKLKLYAQHIDTINKKNSKSNRATGYITAESIKAAGAKGTIINHSEHQLKEDQIKQAIKDCKKHKLKSILCVKSISEVKKYKKLKPDYMAYEDPKIIGTKTSITKHNTKQIKEFTKLLSRTKIIPICGAGIHNNQDYQEAKSLSCKGVLIASALTKSKNPTKLLNSFTK